MSPPVTRGPISAPQPPTRKARSGQKVISLLLVYKGPGAVFIPRQGRQRGALGSPLSLFLHRAPSCQPRPHRAGKGEQALRQTPRALSGSRGSLRAAGEARLPGSLRCPRSIRSRSGRGNRNHCGRGGNRDHRSAQGGAAKRGKDTARGGSTTIVSTPR